MTSGEPRTAAPWPTEIRLRRGVGRFEIDFDDGARFVLPARLLRAMSPSAADRGHGGPSFEPFVGIRNDVRLQNVQAVGSYAVRLVFDDGHDSGLYTWERLHRIGREADALTARLDR